ncbi:MAG: hypothetical protein WDK96_01790 [Candidatus Paceibacterota bacterium]|jgi:hypothetical protein
MKNKKDVFFALIFLNGIIKELQKREIKKSVINPRLLTDKRFISDVSLLITINGNNEKEESVRRHNSRKSVASVDFDNLYGIDLANAFFFLNSIFGVLKKTKNYSDDYIWKLLDIEDFSSIIPKRLPR